MSANSAVTVLRSPSSEALSTDSRTVMGGVDVSSRGAGGPDVSAVVHCPQNLKPGGFSELHFGQTSARAVVHCPQNLIPAGFSNPHFEQRTEIPGPLSRKTVQTRPVSGSIAKARLEWAGATAAPLGSPLPSEKNTPKRSRDLRRADGGDEMQKSFCFAAEQTRRLSKSMAEPPILRAITGAVISGR
jgi:hypothetical protein